MDCHIHTPASTDYQQPDVTFIEILQKAEARGLNIIAFTDHNTVAGYRKMMEDVEQLALLEKLNRLLPAEKSKLAEYRRLFNSLLVLPGFEFTATFGFHILAIFSPHKPVRDIEHLLITLNIPSDQLDEGSQTVGATTDVLTAYQILNRAGALVIAAHANSSNGVAMRGFNFGGQTKIAYTQDLNLHALEVTDLDVKGPKSTAAFFNGTKPEYPRRMFTIQGSDAHRLTSDPSRKKVLGLGDRATDVLLSELSFESLRDLFQNNDFSRTRPHRHKEEPAYDYLQAALEQGSNIIQEFHESMSVRGGKLYSVLADVCAFANTNGGTLYIGLNPDQKLPHPGITDPEQNITQLEREINNRISPELTCSIDSHEYKGKKIIRVLVPRGTDAPYAVDDNKIYVRDEAETGLAVRDEIVGLVLRGNKLQTSPSSPNVPITDASPIEEKPQLQEKLEIEDPRTGVEVLQPEERQGKYYYTMRDLRNGNVVKNVTRASARKLWHYAITAHMEIFSNVDRANIQWQSEVGLIKKYKQGKIIHYDFIQKTSGGYRFFFGVTPDGIHGIWKNLTGEDEG